MENKVYIYYLTRYIYSLSIPGIQNYQILGSIYVQITYLNTETLIHN